MKTIISLFYYKRIWIFSIILPILITFLLFSGLKRQSLERMKNMEFKPYKVILEGSNDSSWVKEVLSSKSSIELITEDFAEMSVIDNKASVGIVLEKDKQSCTIFHRNDIGKVHQIENWLRRTEQENIINTNDVLDINFINIKNKDISQPMKDFIESMGLFFPFFIFISSLWLLIIPISTIFSDSPKKGKLPKAAIWDKLLGVNVFSIIILILIILTMNFALNSGSEKIAFFDGLLNQYFSVKAISFWVIIVFFSQLFWTNIQAFFTHLSKTFIGSFGINELIWIVFSIMAMTILYISFQNDNEVSYLGIILPIFNSFEAFKMFLLGSDYSIFQVILLLLSFVFWAVISFFLLKFTID